MNFPFRHLETIESNIAVKCMVAYRFWINERENDNEMKGIGNKPVLYIDLDGLEPANNPENPAYQEGRDPISTINAICSLSVGDEIFKGNFKENNERCFCCRCNY